MSRRTDMTAQQAAVWRVTQSILVKRSKGQCELCGCKALFFSSAVTTYGSAARISENGVITVVQNGASIMCAAACGGHLFPRTKHGDGPGNALYLCKACEVAMTNRHKIGGKAYKWPYKAVKRAKKWWSPEASSVFCVDSILRARSRMEAGDGGMAHVITTNWVKVAAHRHAETDNELAWVFGKLVSFPKSGYLKITGYHPDVTDQSIWFNCKLGTRSNQSATGDTPAAESTASTADDSGPRSNSALLATVATADGPQAVNSSWSAEEMSDLL